MGAVHLFPKLLTSTSVSVPSSFRSLSLSLSFSVRQNDSDIVVVVVVFHIKENLSDVGAVLFCKTGMGEGESRKGEGRGGRERSKGLRATNERTTEMRFNLCTWFDEVSSCSSLTVLPGTGWVLLNKICKN